MLHAERKRLTTIPTAAGGSSRLAYQRAKDAGVDTPPLLSRAGLTAALLQDRRARVSVQSQITLLELVAEALHDDLLGFHLALEYECRKVGLLYYVLASSQNLGEALRRAERYSSIVNEGVALTYSPGEATTIRFRYVGITRHGERHQIEFWMTSLVRICRQLANQRLTPARVRMMHRRNGDSGELRGFFGCDVEFGADCDEVMFAGPIGQVAIPSADPYLNEMLVEYCEEALAHRAKTSGSFRTRVENAIVPLLPHGRARMKTIAETLGMSQRTLTRRLSMEGITFAEVLDELRSDLARRYLREADLKISEIAWLLGYGEVSAFTRAFKRWTGTTPRVSRFSRNVKLFRVPAA